MFRMMLVNKQKQFFTLLKQVKVKSLGDFMSRSPKLVQKTQANKHENFI